MIIRFWVESEHSNWWSDLHIKWGANSGGKQTLGDNLNRALAAVDSGWWHKIRQQPNVKGFFYYWRKGGDACNPHPFGIRPSDNVPCRAFGCTLDTHKWLVCGALQPHLPKTHWFLYDFSQNMWGKRVQIRRWLVTKSWLLSLLFNLQILWAI